MASLTPIMKERAFSLWEKIILSALLGVLLGLLGLFIVGAFVDCPMWTKSYQGSPASAI